MGGGESINGCKLASEDDPGSKAVNQRDVSKSWPLGGEWGKIMSESQVFPSSITISMKICGVLSLLGFKWKCEGHVILCFFFSFFFFKGRQFNPGFSIILPSPTLEFHARHRDKGVRLPEKEFLPLRMAYFKRLL